MTSYNILLVDDDPNVLKFLKRILTEDDFIILTAASAKEALIIAENNTVNVLMTDILMPEMDGIELLRCFNQLSPDTICIAASAVADTQTILKTVNNSNIFSFIQKGRDNPERIKTQVRAAMEQCRKKYLSAQSIDNLQKENQALKDRLTCEQLAETATSQHSIMTEKRIQLECMKMLHKISDHFRQPLNILSLAVQDVAEAHLCGELDSHYINETEKYCMATIKRLTDLLDSALVCYSCDSSDMFRPSDEINKIFSYIKKRCRSKDIKLSLNFSGENADWNCKGSKSDFRRAVINILDNALEAVERKSKELPAAINFIDMSIENTAAYLILTITDSGTGMDNQTYKRVFEPFFSTKSTAYGLGLSMFYTKFIIENIFKGSIYYYTSKGAGTKCFVIIPK